MTETRRGRKSQSSYRELVSKALTMLHDSYTLDTFPVLSQLPAIEQWEKAHPDVYWARGQAIVLYLRQSIAEVIEKIGATDDVALKRVAEYIHLRYQESVQVKEIADRWQCSPVHVWRRAGNRAVETITERFLTYARAVEPISPNVRQISQARKIS